MFIKPTYALFSISSSPPLFSASYFLIFWSSLCVFATLSNSCLPDWGICVYISILFWHFSYTISHLPISFFLDRWHSICLSCTSLISINTYVPYVRQHVQIIVKHKCVCALYCVSLGTSAGCWYQCSIRAQWTQLQYDTMGFLILGLALVLIIAENL